MVAARYYVYVLFRENGVPFYVGKGQRDRWTTHEWYARRGAKGYRFNIIRAMLARGAEVPRVKLHEGLTEECAHRYETALIVAVGRYPHGPLVNQTDGGEGTSGLSRKHTPEQTAKIRKALLGRKHTAESLAKMRAAHAGKRHSPETKAKMSAALRGRKPAPQAIAAGVALRKGKRLSAQHIANLSAVRLGKPQSPELIAKRAAALRGKKLSPEHRANVRAGKLRFAAIERLRHAVSSESTA